MEKVEVTVMAQKQRVIVSDQKNAKAKMRELVIFVTSKKAKVKTMVKVKMKDQKKRLLIVLDQKLQN